ncbi:MAG: efflux RND transporter periplasmic adaptor subunit [Jannaschia sp.]
MFISRLIAILALFAAPSVALAQDAVKLAKIFTVTEGDAGVTRQFFGRVVAKETVDIAFQVGGQIVEFPIIEGNFIDKGTLVAGLDLELFQLSLDQAVLQREQAERTLRRLEQLQGNVVAQTSVEDAATAFNLAEIAVRQAERALSDARLVAPFDSLVASRSVANFSSVSPGQTIARLHNMSEVRIEIDAPEILFQEAGRDPDIDVWAEFPFADERFPLEVREFNAETAEIGQTLTITFGMPPPAGIPIVPGLSVRVYVEFRSGTRHPEIPASAVLTENDGATIVMLFSPSGADEGTVSEVPVEIVPTNSGLIQVVSGLAAGQEIVSGGAGKLNPGDRVTRFTGFAD